MRGTRVIAGGVAVAVLVALAMILVAVLNQPSARSVSHRPPAAVSATATRSSSPGPTVTAPPAAPSASWATWVTAENSKPGVNSRITPAAGKAPGLDAFADRVSVRPGQPVGLYVSATGPVHARALRVGYYGGTGMREVWSGDFTATVQPPAVTQNAPLADAGGLRNSGAATAPWTLTATLDTTSWPEGAYVIRLDAGPASRFVLLTVRSANAVGRVLLVNSPMTWQAYNTWGGRGLYGDENNQFNRRSLAVSFDRPYDDGYGSGRFFTYDAKLISEAESLGLPLAWATDYDLALDPHLLDGAAAVVFGGHAEYWTAGMRDAVVAQVAKGTNLAVFGANTAYWRVRLVGRDVAPAAGPPRRDGLPRMIFGAKNASLDPLASSDPSGATARFRDSPSPRPEEGLTGMRYDCHPAATDWVVSDPTWWGYAGTHLAKGSVLRGVVGPESDRVYPAATRPRPEQVVAYTPMSCGQHRTWHTAVYWTNSAGAGVFAAGTMDWVRSLGLPGVGPEVRKITDNILTAFATPRAGQSHPAKDTVGNYHLPTTATSGAV